MMRRALREPLLYFLLVGAALFAVTDLLGRNDGHRIVVSDADRARLSDQWRAQMGRAPTESQLQALIDQWIREEVYYREALAMGLDDDDVIIRRRLAQKLTFLTEDMATEDPPDEDTLRAYYKAHADRYAEPARFSFSHRYFSDDRRSDAEADARRALAGLNAAQTGASHRRPATAVTVSMASAADTAVTGADAGDPFMLQHDYVARSRREIAELFGNEFAAALVELPPGSWQGPVQSAYGWHLVRVDQQLPPRQPDFDQVAQQVTADFREDQRRRANEDYYQSLLRRYEIVRQ